MIALAYDILFLKVNSLDLLPGTTFPVLANPAYVSRSQVFGSAEFGLYLFDTKFFSLYAQYSLMNSALKVYGGGSFRMLPAFEVVDPETSETINFSYRDGYFLAGASYRLKDYVRLGGYFSLAYMGSTLESAFYPSISVGAEFPGRFFSAGFSIRNVVFGKWDALTLSGDFSTLLYGDKSGKWDLYFSLLGMYSGYTGVVFTPSFLVRVLSFGVGVSTSLGAVAEKVTVSASYRIPQGVSFGYSFGYSSVGQLLHRVFVVYQRG